MEAYLITAISGLATAIGVLWASVQRHAKQVERHAESTEKRLTDCEDDRAGLWRVLLRTVNGDPEAKEIITQRVAETEGKRAKPDSWKP